VGGGYGDVMSETHCWFCGTELNLVDTRSLGSPFATTAVGRMPPAKDHHHAKQPPSPDDLVEAGSRILEKIRKLTAGDGL
jgi:hypothetical protein